jgi:hypothetical protein
MKKMTSLEQSKKICPFIQKKGSAIMCVSTDCASWENVSVGYGRCILLSNAERGREAIRTIMKEVEDVEL